MGSHQIVLTMTLLVSILVTISLSLATLGVEQCDQYLPDGTLCGENDYKQAPDPLSCWHYYECEDGCVEHQACEEDYKFEVKYEWCTYPEDVDCGDRPCNDDLHCPAPPEVCKDGILVVGGKTSAGPSTEVSLLSKDQGWCSQSGFPELPHPLVNPGAYFLNGYLFVCGFPGEFPCMYTSRGWDGWRGVSSLPNQTDFKMTYSALVGSVMMISKDLHGTYRLQHNPAHTNNGGSMTQWMEMTGSPFYLGRDLQRSSFSDYKGDLYVSGGYLISHYGNPTEFGEARGSVGFVARWSSVGSELGNGPPAFEDGVVPNMMNQSYAGGDFFNFPSGREAHATVEFDGKLVVSGGFSLRSEDCGGDMFDWCCHCTSCRKIYAAEYFAGDEWLQMSNMRHARAHFGLQPLCNELVAFGGVDGYDGGICNDDEANQNLLSSLEVLSSVEGQWAYDAGFAMPEAKAYFTSIPVTDLECM